MKTKKTKFFEGFLGGFIIGLFVYFVYFMFYQNEVFSIIWAIIFSLIPAIILGLFLVFDKGRDIDTSRVSPLILNPDFDKGESFKLTKTNWPSKYLAITAFILGLLSLLSFSLVFSPMAFVFGIIAIMKGRKEGLSIKLKVLVALGIFFSFTSIVYFLYSYIS